MSKIKSVLWNERSSANYAHIKIDGNFTRITKNEFGKIKCSTSIDTDITQQIMNCAPGWLSNLQRNMPVNSSILGELYYYDCENKCGLPASYIKTGLASGENYVISKENSKGDIIDGRLKRILPLKISTKQLCFSCFAIELGFDGINSFSPLEEIEKVVLRLGVEFAPYIKVSCPTCECFFEKYNRDKLLGYWLNIYRARHDVKGLVEGWVLKDSNLLNWRKVKEENSIDVFITGYESGNGKYRNMIGSLLGSVFNGIGKPVEICKVSGFSDEIRKWISDCFFSRNGLMRENIMQQVIEVKYQLVASKGRLRHCRFFRWKDDKLATECLTEQDDELVKFWG